MDVKRLPLYFIAFVYYNLSVETLRGKTKKPWPTGLLFLSNRGLSAGLPSLFFSGAVA